LGRGVGDNEREVGFGAALILAQLGEPAVAPVFGALQFPENGATRLIERPEHAMQHIAAEFAFRHRLNQVTREAGAQRLLELKLQGLALQLLRALLGLAFQVLDLALHGGHLLLLFEQAELEAFFGLLLGLVAHGGQRLLHLLFDGQVHLAASVVQLALLADQLGLGLLGFGQLAFALTQHALQVQELPVLLVEIGGRELLCLAAFLRDDGLALNGDLFGHVLGNGGLLLGEQGLLAGDLALPLGDLGVLLGHRMLELLARGREHRSGELLRELDFGRAVRALDGGLGHGWSFTLRCRSGLANPRCLTGTLVGAGREGKGSRLSTSRCSLNVLTLSPAGQQHFAGRVRMQAWTMQSRLARCRFFASGASGLLVRRARA
jgi:hypothetical protein